MFNEKLSNAIESGEVALEPDLNSSPMETSLKGFGLYFPVFENLVNHKLSGTSAKRILIALFANKLEERKINLKRPEEVEALKIANKLFEDILVIHLSALLEAEDRRQKAINSPTGKTDSELQLEQMLKENGVQDVVSSQGNNESADSGGSQETSGTTSVEPQSNS